MLNVSQEERIAKQLLPEVLEEKSATQFTASSPGAQLLGVANGTGDEKQKETSILRPGVLFPISESRAKTQLEHSRYLKNMGFACLEIIACCNVPGIHDACVGTSKMELCSSGHPLLATIVEDTCSKTGADKLWPEVQIWPMPLFIACQLRIVFTFLKR